MYLHICILYIYIYVSIYIYICIYTYIHTYIHIHTYTHKYIKAVPAEGLYHSSICRLV